MKAIHVTKVGGPEVMQQVDIPVPEVAAGMVRLKNEVIAINFHDINARRYGEPGLDYPYIPGCDFSGTVESEFRYSSKRYTTDCPVFHWFNLRKWA